MRKTTLTVFVCLALAILTPRAFGQSNDLMDALLAQTQASVELTAYFVLLAGGAIDEDTAPSAAMATLQGKDWGFEEAQPREAIRLRELSHMVMQALDIKGGLMYRILPSPRYAYRDLAFYQIVPRGNPRTPVGGEIVLDVLSRAIEWRERYQ